MDGRIEFNAVVLNEVVHKALRTASMLSYGSMVLPYAEDVNRPEVKAARSPPLLQWFLERENFDQQVAQQYTQLSVGAVREVVAPTGVGKSTKLAYVIASAHKVNGIVLLPNDALPAHLIRYTRKLYVQLGGEVSVAVLRTAHLTAPIKAPCVYYASGSTFLARLAIRPNLLEELGVDFIYLDESHERVPAYLFFRYLLTAGLTGSVKVFYGTATGATDIVERKENITAVPEQDMSTGSPKGATVKSPLHYRNITMRTMAVFALDSEIRMWADYYDEHDVPVYPCYMEDGMKSMNAIDDFLRNNDVCVILTTSVFRTGFTYLITNVICTGYHAVLRTNFQDGVVSIKREPITPSLRVQTMGRVDRIVPGRGYYADVATSYESAEMTDDVALYVYLWAKVFNLKINDPAVSAFAEVTGELSRKAAAMLLHSRIPPALLLPYLGDNGFYKCWAKFASCMLYSTNGMDTVSVEDVNTDHWTQYSTGPVDYCSTSITYKSAVRFPREWQCLPAVAWTYYTGEVARLDNLRPRSVVSAVSTVAPVKQARVSSLTVDMALQQASTRRPTLDKQLPAKPRALAPVRESVESIGVPAYTELKDAYSVRDTLPYVEAPAPEYKHTRSRSQPTFVHNEYQPSKHAGVETWRSEVASVRTVRVGSDSSDDQQRIGLRQVDPVKYRYCKFYPMDPAAFDIFTEHELRVGTDIDRVSKLLTGARNISSIRGDADKRREEQRKYFLSVVRVHNYAIAQKAQLSSNVRMTAIEKLTMKLHGDLRKAEEDINETAKLLKAFMLESWFVGIDKRVPRSSEVSSEDLITPDHSHDEARAKVMMAFGAPAVVDALWGIKARSVPYKVDGIAVANAWVFGDKILTASHIFETKGAKHQHASGGYTQPPEDDVIVFDSSITFPNTAVMRTPEDVESVYFITYDRMQREVIIIGDYELFYSGGVAYVQCVLEKGHSGALAISVRDGAVLGMYASYFGGVGESVLSLVVPADKFMSLL